jgi:hypothetical protein
MKKILALALIISCSLLNAQQNCDSGIYYTNPNWVKRLVNNAYTWAFDEVTRFDITYAPTNTYITVEQMETQIENAIGKWLFAIHGNNPNFTLINFTKDSNYASADIKITFSDLGANSMCGRFNSSDQIEINSVTRNQNDEPFPKIWTSSELQSTLMHEFGHVFMGPTNGNPGHVNNPDAIMYALPCNDPHGVGTTLTQCEKEYIMNLYNPLHSVTVANNFGGYGGGKVKVDAIEHLNIPSAGKVFDAWRKNSFPHTLEAMTQQFVDPANGKTYNRLFNNWTNVASGTNIGNNPLSILPQSTTYRANFAKEFNVTLASPTYVESNSGGYYSVDGNQGTSTVIVELNSKQIQAYPEGNNWAFIDWKDANNVIRYGNPLTLAPTDHVVNLQGRFKKHLASNSTLALSSNGQRKILRDIIGVYHAVYESAGKIFYTSSPDGSTWTNEIYLSGEIDSYDFISRNPAIDLYYDNSVQTWKPVVVWESRYPDNSGFELAARRISGSAWAPQEYITNGNTVMTTNDGTPALAYPYVISRGTDGLYITRCYGIGQYGAGEWTPDASKISGTTAASKNPSALYDPWKGTYLTHLVWDDNASVFYRNTTYSSGYQWSPIETVASGMDEISNTHSSISMDNAGYIWIAWKFLNTEIINANRIRVRKRLGANSYGVVSSFGIDSGNPQFHNPSISGNRQKPGNNNISVAWQKSTNQIQQVSYVNGAWGGISTLSSNNQTPQLVFNESAVPFNNKIGFSRSTNGPVYALTPISFNEWGGMQKSSEQTVAPQYIRGVITTLDRIDYKTQFGNIVLTPSTGEQMKIELASLPDTIPVNTISEIGSFLRSEPFIALEKSEISLELHEYPLSGTTDELNGKEITYMLEFVENGTNKVLYTMHVSRLSERKTTIELLPYSFGVTGNKEVYIRLSIVPQGDIQPVFTLLNEYYDSDESGLSKRGVNRNATVVDLIPKEYRLTQNFPNPFNPVTTIQYELPNSEYVTVTVIDAVGRLVATIVDGYRESGVYQSHFDASQLSSGIYFYTMRAGKYTATKKMMLVK